MNLHEDKELFRNAIKITAQQINIPEIYVEKDYWVTYALHMPLAKKLSLKAARHLPNALV